MVFRLPTHLESFVPPQYEHRPHTGPWRGAIVVTGMRNSDRGSSQEIRVTAVETDGEKVQQWPRQFFVHVMNDRSILRDVQAWVKQFTPPLCTFLPDRLRETNTHAVNQANFRSLSRILFENQTVAIAPWGTDAFPGAGLIIYPAQHSSALLVGALFLYSAFPDFVVGGIPSPTIPTSLHAMQARHPQYMTASSSYSISPHHRHGHSASPRSNPNSPLESHMGHRQEPYRYIVPRTMTSSYPNPGPASSSSAASGWSMIKAEEDVNYATFSQSH